MATRTDYLKIRLTSDGEGRVKASLAGVGKEMGQLDDQTQRVERSAISLRGVLGTIATGAIIKSTLDTIVRFERLDATLRSVEGSAEGGARAMASIQELTKATPFQLDKLTGGYIKLKAFGLDPLDGTYQSLIDQASKLGAEEQTLEGIILAVGQAWAKGKLQGEEILQLVERGVPVWEILAEATGKTNEELQDMSAKGELGRDAIRLLIDEMGRMSAGAAAEQVNTLGGAFSNLQDQAMMLAKDLGDAGLGSALTSLVRGLTDVITPGTELNKIALALSPALTGLLVANLLGPAFARAGVGAMSLATGMGTAAGRGAALRGVLAVLGGPGGLILGAATALGTWALTSRTARADTGELVDEVDRLLGKFDALERRQVNKVIEELETAIEAQRRKVLAVFETARRFDRDGESMLPYEKEHAMELQVELDRLINRYDELKAKRDEIGARGEDGKEKKKNEDGTGGGGGSEGDALGIYAANFDAALRQRTESLVEALRTEEEAERLSYEQRLIDLEDAYVSGIIPTEQVYKEQLEALEASHQARMTEIHDKEISNRTDLEKKAQQEIDRVRSGAVNNAVGLLRTLAGESQTAAYLSIAITKGMAIAQTLAHTQTAAMLAYASQLVPGDPTSVARAQVAYGKTMAMGKLSAGLIGLSGLAEASQVGDDGAAPGSAANPVHTAPAGGAPGTPQASVEPRSGMTVQFLGDVYGLDDFGERVSEVLRDRFENTDDVLITRNSRQARELGVS